MPHSHHLVWAETKTILQLNAQAVQQQAKVHGKGALDPTGLHALLGGHPKSGQLRRLGAGLIMRSLVALHADRRAQAKINVLPKYAVVLRPLSMDG